MMRRIAANHACRQPGQVVCVDTETRLEPLPGRRGGRLHALRLWVASVWRNEGGKVTRYRRASGVYATDFWGWLYGLLTPERSTWLWAHSLGYDLTALRVWDELTGKLLTLDAPADPPTGAQAWRGLLVSQDPPTVLVARHEGGCVLTCVDTLNWVPTSIEKLAPEVGARKVELPAQDAPHSEWFERCSADLTVLERVVQKLLLAAKTFDLGNLRYTAASQAYASWRHTKVRADVCVGHEEAVKAREREAYYGARQWPHFVGEVLAERLYGLAPRPAAGRRCAVLASGGVYRLDLTAAYPAVMRGSPYPVAYMRTVYQPSVERLAEHFGACAVVARVHVNSPDAAYPLRRGGRTMHCAGRFWTALAGPDLLDAVASGHIDAVDWAQLYTRACPFDRWVDRMWAHRMAARATGDQLLERLIKTLMNALHGKFGQRPARWSQLPGRVAPQEWGQYPVLDHETGRVVVRRAVASAVQERSEGGEREESFPAVSAYVTAYFRRLMGDAINAAGCNNVLYEDADSLHVTRAGLDNLTDLGWVDECRMGAFRVVEQAEHAVYLGPQDYLFGGKAVLSGLAGNALRLPSGLFEETVWERLEGYLAAEPPPGPITWERVVERPVHALPGRLTESGRVVPWVIDH